MKDHSMYARMYIYYIYLGFNGTDALASSFFGPTLQNWKDPLNTNANSHTWNVLAFGIKHTHQSIVPDQRTEEREARNSHAQRNEAMRPQMHLHSSVEVLSLVNWKPCAAADTQSMHAKPYPNQCFANVKPLRKAFVICGIFCDWHRMCIYLQW